MSDDQEFQKVESGSADSIPIQAGSIKKNGYCMLKGFPCKVTQYSTAKPGKHGSAKATIVGVDIFTNKKYQDTAPTSATMYVPNVTKSQYECADISEDEFASLVLPNGQLKEDLKLPVDDEDTYNELRKIWEERGDKTIYFTVQSACGQEKIIAGRSKQ